MFTGVVVVGAGTISVIQHTNSPFRERIHTTTEKVSGGVELGAPYVFFEIRKWLA
jgi:hypothetical protein